MIIGIGWILYYSTVNLSVFGATDNEVGMWIVECIGTSSYSCNRVTLYLLGECESKKLSPVPAACEGSIQEYVTENELQNERRLTQDEVVEDFRILESLPPR
jgi:hypothetical protein